MPDLSRSERPFYEDDSVALHCCDYRQADLAGDVIVTDPPYGTGYYRTDTDALPAATLKTWTETFAAVAIFGWPEKLVALSGAAGVVPDEWVTWWPTNARQGRGFNRVGLLREVECIAVFGRCEWGNLRQPRATTTTPMPNPGVRGLPDPESDARMGDVWRDESPNLNPNQPDRLHPNEKPVSVMRKLLTALPPGTVIDPFAGSAPTLLAARELGRRAIGYEIDPTYCKAGARRLAQTEMLIGEAA